MEAPCPLVMPLANDARTEHVSALLEHMTQVFRVARSLASGGRQMDLNGLDEMIGVLCAQCIDLPQEIAKTFRPRLAALLAELDVLSGLLAEVDRSLPCVPMSELR